MAVRQYIGARYVAKIYENTQNPNSADWEENVNYEPLMIVTYNNGSYLSKKIVPANIGNPAANPGYWVQTGFYNGQIVSLQEQIGVINETLASVEDAHTELENKVKNIKNKKYIIIGDSYERVTSFGSHVSEYLRHGATSFVSTNVQKSTDGYIYVASRGGAGFTNTDQGVLTGNGFLDLLTETATLMTAEEKADIDTILIAGGVNDSSVNVGDEHLSMLNTNMAAFNNYVLSNFPNAQVNIFMLGRIRQLDTHEGRNPVDVRYNIFRYIDIAGGLNWGFIANSQYVCFQRENVISSDNLHPVESFGWPLARFIVEGLINGSVDVTWIDNAFSTLIPAEGLTVLTPQVFSVNLVNGVKTIKFKAPFQINASSGNPMQFQFGQPVKIGTQDGFFAISPIDVYVPLIGWDTVGKKFEIMNAYIRFYGYDVFIVNRGTPTYGNDTVSYESILGDNNISFMCDTLLT